MLNAKNTIRSVLAQVLKVPPEQLADDLSLRDSVGVDSTEMVEAVIALERAFGTELAITEVTKTSSINDIAQLIVSRVPA